MVFEARVLRIIVEARFSEHGKSFGALRAGVLYTGDGVKFAGRRFVRFAKLLHDKLTEGIILQCHWVRPFQPLPTLSLVRVARLPTTRTGRGKTQERKLQDRKTSCCSRPVDRGRIAAIPSEWRFPRTSVASQLIVELNRLNVARSARVQHLFECYTFRDRFN